MTEEKATYLFGSFDAYEKELRRLRFENEKLKKVNTHLLGDATVIMDGKLPDVPRGMPHITLTIQAVKQYNAILSELGHFVADILSVKIDKLCSADMVFGRNKLHRANQLLAEANRIIIGEFDWDDAHDKTVVDDFYSRSNSFLKEVL